MTGEGRIDKLEVEEIGGKKGKRKRGRENEKKIDEREVKET